MHFCPTNAFKSIDSPTHTYTHLSSQAAIDTCYDEDDPPAKRRGTKRPSSARNEYVGRHMEKRFPDMILYQGKVTKKWDDGELEGDGEELFRVRYDCVWVVAWLSRSSGWLFRCVVV